MKFINFFLLILLSFNISIKANSNNKLQSLLKEGGKLVFIRHAIAPGGGDPVNFDILRCETQRNLNKEGITQSINIGKFFSENNLKIDKVLSSEWCRCKQTAQHAFNIYETKSFLNSFFSEKFANNKTQQIKELKQYIQNWNSKENLILITHFVVIDEMLNISAASGEIIVTNKDFSIIERFK